MRYCIGCGSPIGNDRFCDKCGTDNGTVSPSGKEHISNPRQDRISRYCIGCGNEIGEDRFCPVCGTDNGQMRGIRNANRNYNRSSSARKMKMPDIHIYPEIILHWAAMVFLLITALLLLKTTYSNAENIVTALLLNPFGMAFAAGYFVLGAWSMIPSVAFILGGGSGSVKKVSATAVFLLVLTLISYILNLIVMKFSDLPEIWGTVSAMFGTYRINMSYLIFFEIVTIAAGITAAYFTRGKEMR